MFTGLIETTGKIVRISGSESMTLGILPESRNFDVLQGGSVSINGTCLTLESTDGAVLFFTAIHETLSRTTFNKARLGDIVNLERALPVNGRLDGHFVLGHIDAVGTIKSDRKSGNSIDRSIKIPEKLHRFMAEKGSVAIDGISLTIAGCSDCEICISFIPHTLDKTTMALKRTGDEVNIECDVLARYLARLIDNKNEKSGNSDKSQESVVDRLERLGF
jgi:riboflavin synthase